MRKKLEFMSFKEYLNNLLSRQIDKHPKTTFWCWIAAMVCCGVGSYKLAEYLSSISPGVKIFFTILGVPVLIGTIILVLYILWKVYKGVSWLMEQPSYGSWWGSIWVPNPFERFLNTLANNEVVINIETSKSKLEAKTESEDNTYPDTITSPVSGKDV